MTQALEVTKKGPEGTWAVYEVDDISRDEGELVPPAGPMIRLIASWTELKDLAVNYEVEWHNIFGDGLEEMELELGPKPE